MVESRQLWRAVGVATSFGFMAALLAAGGVFAGRWLDGLMHTAPIFTVVGLLVGLAAGFAMLLREIGRVMGDRPRR